MKRLHVRQHVDDRAELAGMKARADARPGAGR
ncbi:hypothetical protein HNQ70_003149 [Quisquiliibacterium transsilvanicum]|uniref:Uncharacterized protein n=1 Tax=Quisquiliibacterium transsilvanicum TaxID=1549638 RepID=A0A7W8HJB5_9BURK|nr:hypothetical protein [Quisquiliibacterium transsilvanicum]